MDSFIRLKSNIVTTSQQQVVEYLMSLPEKKKKIVMERSFMLVRAVGRKQLELLEKFEKDVVHPKTELHLYFFSIVKSFWKDADFALGLGKKKNRSYAIYPARTMMEKVLKILWFTKQTKAEQDEIAKKELLLSCLTHYNIAKEQFYKDQYQKINKGNIYPDIDTVKRADLKAFPVYEELCEKSGLIDAKNLYFSYRYLSGMPHGDLLSTYMINNLGMENAEYRRALSLACRYEMEMIKVVDLHLNGATTMEVKDVLEKVNKLIGV